jgi:DNA-binding NtrC family response regulator
LAVHLLARAARRSVEYAAGLLTRPAIDALCHYHWQGNVRELANTMDYAWIVSGGQPITPDHLPALMRAARAAPAAPVSRAVVHTPAPHFSGGSLEVIEMEHILRVLEKHGGHKASAAEELGISLKTLYNKLNKYQESRRAG